jgi:nifR3 family TIM-barrel protein
LYAPLAGCSDYPFRKMSARYKPGLVFCEMVKMEALVRCDSGTLQLLDYSHDMHPIGAQLCGCNPRVAKKAAKMIEEMGFDSLDLNCGCPVDKVTKDGSGSGMLKNLRLIGDVVAEMASSISIPVTLKIRAGWDEDSLVVPEIVQVAELAGAQALTIHGRTRQQGYTGSANWDWISLCKKHATKIKIIGNGDVFSAEDALKMFATTGCDGILVARGTLGDPWIVDDIRRLAAGETLQERSIEERKEALLEHLSYIEAYFPERKAVVDMRRVGCWYFKKSAGTREFREAITKSQTLQEIETLIRNFT